MRGCRRQRGGGTLGWTEVLCLGRVSVSGMTDPVLVLQGVTVGGYQGRQEFSAISHSCM